MIFTMNELKPKNDTPEMGGWYWCQFVGDKSWHIVLFVGENQSTPFKINYYIPIRLNGLSNDIIDAIKPISDNKPKKFGQYLAHIKSKDTWGVLLWSENFGWNNDIDCYIPYDLLQEPIHYEHYYINDEDKVLDKKNTLKPILLSDYQQTIDALRTENKLLKDSLSNIRDTILTISQKIFNSKT